MEKKFNVRVYGIIINEDEEVLLTDEIRYGREITKFPGGGMIFGEGTIECIKRECMEEMGQEPFEIKHFYTTDFFQESAFNKNDQIVSIYYLLSLPDTHGINTVAERFDFKNKIEEAQVFRWKKITELDVNEITFPIDRIVAGMLRKMKGLRKW